MGHPVSQVIIYRLRDLKLDKINEIFVGILKGK